MIGNGAHAAGQKTFIQGIFGAVNPAGALPVNVFSNGHLATAISAARFKKDIEDMDAYSEKIYDLRPVTFVYKSDPTETRVPGGLIAEDVKEIYPELVVYDKEGEILSVASQYLPFLMLNELKKCEKRIADLERR
jgi:hypothetical protein